ncbi:helix-turn-helix domain-containing protein [Paenactinomyces guangxiensis]|uniref:Helix-turn-helix domain-containing protein n=1 Tax=Paenactinomyces guangxiensis TaxID=1490290 RepID=A0A7W2A745_9BACL|nr:helix-turn-helix domain-containing protein [Paenactinomyces guangxiensis]MBA4494131.1 helix-turn-helix domain-containing protein [Paenactinomyces guangxiensis]MBH8591124.1 helix-turn-helix domain-containing protein [Paenactinomyces guangxiensis]
MKYHYGVTIREAREKLNMTQAQLAEKWPQAGGGTGVSVNYVSDVERGIKNITDPQTLRRLCKILQIPLWKMGLSDYDPFNPSNFRETFMYDETLNTAEGLIKRTWNLRRVMSLPYVEEAVNDLNRLFDYLQANTPPPVRLDKRFQMLYAQVLRLNAVIDVENQRYEEALNKFRRMHEIAKAIDHTATLAMSYLNIGTELERMGKQEEAIDYLELARDESFRASKHVMVVTNAYLARAYASAGQKVKFKRAIEAALRTARSIENYYYGDGTDFVFHSLSGVLAEKSYGYLEIGEPEETLAMQEEIKSQIALEANIWLDAWIPLDWARAYLMLGQVDKCVQAGQEFYRKAKLLKSPHAKSRAYRLLNTIEAAGYSDVQAVKDFRHMLDNEEDKNGLKELDAHYFT